VGAEENLQVVRTYFATVGRAENGAVQRAIAEVWENLDTLNLHAKLHT